MARHIVVRRQLVALLAICCVCALLFFRPALADEGVEPPVSDEAAVEEVQGDEDPSNDGPAVPDEGEELPAVEQDDGQDDSQAEEPAAEEPAAEEPAIEEPAQEEPAAEESEEPAAGEAPVEEPAAEEPEEPEEPEDESEAAEEEDPEEISMLFPQDKEYASGWTTRNGHVYYTDPATGKSYKGGVKTVKGLCPPIPQAKGYRFSDVGSSTPHEEDIGWMLSYGISTGWVETDGTRTFRALTYLARADMAAFLYRLAGSPSYSPSKEDKAFFSDVTSSTPHSKEIWWLAHTGISEGWLEDDGTRTFRPYDSLARADMAAFLYRLAGSPDYTPSNKEKAYFADVDSDTPHANEIWWLAGTGVSEGWLEADGTHTFEPYWTLARADMAAFLHRMLTRAGYEPQASHLYCFDANGALQTGWVEVDGDKYYCEPTRGVVYRSGIYTIDGRKYKFDKDGKYIDSAATAPAWSHIEEGWVNNNHQIIPGAIGKGVDVSEWNGTINWERVKEDGISFAILRVGYGANEGKGYTAIADAEFERNARECERVGMPYGVYLYSYARTADQAKKEAQGVVKLLEGHTLAYPVYIDIEDPSQGRLTAKEFAAIATAFCTTIEEAGYEPGVYSMLSWWDNYFTSPSFNKWSKWIAQINSECQYAGSYRFWQSCWTGTVAGISGNVDLDFEFEEPIPGTSPASSTRTIEDGTYEIAVASAPTLVLGVAGGSKDDRANIGLETDANTARQRFRITWDSAANAYIITNVNSGSVMDLAGSKAVEGANIQQYHSVGNTPDQRWFISETEDGYVISSAVNPTFYLRLDTSAPEEGSNVQLGGSIDSAVTFEIRAVQ